MSFLETPRFPDDISYGSRGGPRFFTNIAPVESGHEKRVILWSAPIHEYDVAYGIKKMDQLLYLKEFFLVVQGRGKGFRFKDHTDYHTAATRSTPVAATDQSIGVGNDSTTVFTLKKNYSVGALSLVRPITKPVAGTVLVALDSVVQTLGVDYTLDATIGAITFAVAPTAAAVVSWGGEFDVPCRFDADFLEVSHDFFEGGRADIMVRELRAA